MRSIASMIFGASVLAYAGSNDPKVLRTAGRSFDDVAQAIKSGVEPGENPGTCVSSVPAALSRKVKVGVLSAVGAP